jgi:hypothetical protein
MAPPDPDPILFSATGSLIEISPRVAVDHYERQARRRIDRDGFAAFSAAAPDRRQVRQLRRLAYRLAADDTLDVMAPVPFDEGVLVVHVYARAGRGSRRGLGLTFTPRPPQD